MPVDVVFLEPCFPRNQREFARVSEVDQRAFGSFLDRVRAAAKLDIEAAGKVLLKPREIAGSLCSATVSEKPGDRPFPARR